MPTLAPTAIRPERSPTTTSPGTADPACEVCPHPVSQHDAIGLRFCRATKNAALDRGCVCRLG
jgi:hypothetical protein